MRVRILKASIMFVMSVLMHQLGSNWMDFGENFIFKTFITKSV